MFRDIAVAVPIFWLGITVPVVDEILIVGIAVLGFALVRYENTATAADGRYAVGSVKMWDP